MVDKLYALGLQPFALSTEGYDQFSARVDRLTIPDGLPISTPETEQDFNLPPTVPTNVPIRVVPRATAFC